MLGAAAHSQLRTRPQGSLDCAGTRRVRTDTEQTLLEHILRAGGISVLLLLSVCEGVGGWFCHDLKHQKDQQSRNRADPAANCVVDPGEGQEFEFVLKSDVVVVVSRDGQISHTDSVIIAPS